MVFIIGDTDPIQCGRGSWGKASFNRGEMAWNAFFGCAVDLGWIAVKTRYTRPNATQTACATGEVERPICGRRLEVVRGFTAEVHRIVRRELRQRNGWQHGASRMPFHLDFSREFTVTSAIQ